MTLSRWVVWVRDVVRVLRGLPDEELRQQTLAMHEQLIRLRRHRAAQEKEREAIALQDIRRIVQEMQALERNLNEAEKATAEYVDRIAQDVASDMEKQIEEEVNLKLLKIEAMYNKDKDLRNAAGSTESVELSFPSSADESKQFPVSTTAGVDPSPQASGPSTTPESSAGG